MYREIDPQLISSEQEFRRYVRQQFGDNESEWIIGSSRGRKIIQTLSSQGIDLRNMVILDLGCGFGGISLSFSYEAYKVLSLDINKALLRIAHVRKKLEKRSNVDTMVGSALNIPLADKSVDMAVVIGVLEWIPSSYPKDDPEDLQFETLKEISRVLKENGKLLLAIENRYYLGYWLGRIDHHTGLRFVPLLPRKLASFISRITKGEPYLNWTHSYWKLNEILQRAGFKVLKIFVGIPSYTLPDEIADVSNEKEVLNKLDSAKLQKLNAIVWKMLNAMKLMKLFSSNFIFLCSKL